MNGAGLVLALIYRPYFSPAVIALAVVGTMALAVWAWRRRSVGRGVAAASGLVMRLIGIGVIGFLLLGPSTLPEQDTDPTRSPVHFLVDASGSMQTQDLHLDENGDPVSRYRFALERWLDADTIATLEAQHDVRVYSFGDRVRATLPEVDDATHRQSNVVESTYDLLSTMNNTQDGSVVILSDGRDSRDADATAAVQLARARDIDLHTVTLGGSTLMRDVSLIATPRQPYLMVNEPGQIDVRLQHINAAGANATLRIREGDEETTRTVTLTDDARLRLDLPIEHDEPGLKVYELSIDQLPGEPEPSNNTQTVFIEVTAERMRVLLLEGQPYWDTKFLAQSLRKDDRLELTHITQINRDRQERIVTRADRVAIAPRNLEEWAEYDVVILGRGMQNVLSVAAAEALPAYVGERGGRVVLARGRSYDAATRNGRAIGRAVAALEPVTWANGRRNDTRLTPTDAGRRHPMFAGLMRATGDAPSPRDLPTLGRAANLESLKPATRVLAATARDGDDEDALLVSMPYGRGMVVALLGEGLWRWSLAGSNDETMAGVFDSFWSNAVRWLVLGSDADAGQDLSIRLSERSIALEDELLVTVVQRGAAADLEIEAVVTDPAGKQTSLSLQDFSGTDQRRTGGYRPTVAGVHTLAVRAVDDTPTNPGDEAIEPVETPFIAYDGNTELLRTAADPALMRSLAVDSGGEVLSPDNPAALLEVLSRQQAARFVPPVPEYVWDRGWVMALLLIWIGLEWIVRKKGGLL
ncbi:MAG: vWA domain-containing protein [Planctomycetota bacterium]